MKVFIFCAILGYFLTMEVVFDQRPLATTQPTKETKLCYN